MSAVERLQVDLNAALATIEYQREELQQYRDQLKKAEAWYTIKVKDNYWVYGSKSAIQAVQDLLFQVYEDGQREA